MSAQDNNGNGDYQGVPAWFRPLIKFGFPALLVLGLLGFIPFVDSPFKQVVSILTSLTHAVASHDKDTGAKLDELIAASRQTCLNTARNEQQALGCWKPR